MNRVKNFIRKTGRVLLNLFYYTSIVLFSFIVLRIFVFGSYKIPTDSMEPAIVPGDYVLVNKLAYGARLFNLFDAVEGKQVKIKRMPGYTRIKNNDVIVFHIPHPHTWDKIEMDMSKYFIKRCIGSGRYPAYCERHLYREFRYSEKAGELPGATGFEG